MDNSLSTTHSQQLTRNSSPSTTHENNQPSCNNSPSSLTIPQQISISTTLSRDLWESSNLIWFNSTWHKRDQQQQMWRYFPHDWVSAVSHRGSNIWSFFCPKSTTAWFYPVGDQKRYSLSLGCMQQSKRHVPLIQIKTCLPPSFFLKRHP